MLVDLFWGLLGKKVALHNQFTTAQSDTLLFYFSGLLLEVQRLNIYFILPKDTFYVKQLDKTLMKKKPLLCQMNKIRSHHAKPFPR